MNNYQFCTDFVLNKYNSNPKVLDFGCGSGKLVEYMLLSNIDCYGCDLYYKGGTSENLPNEDLLKNQKILCMEDETIPFEDGSFDLIVSNQVFEHIPNIAKALKEISRVLKPDGMMLALFPDKSVWREGHSGIPFLHWFHQNSKYRIYYVLALHLLGLGYFRDKKTSLQYAHFWCEWLDNYTNYRSYAELVYEFNLHFNRITHIEHLWLNSRLGNILMPNYFKKIFTRKFAGLVIILDKLKLK
jgi:SAM-dependent methyltransferase